MSFSQLFVDYYHIIRSSLSTSWWFVLPIGLYYIFYQLYIRQIWRDFKGKMKWSMIEVKPPRNIERSPKTMEQVFQGLHGAFSTLNYFDIYLKGKRFQPMFIFEMLGKNGELRFFIRMEKKFQAMVESLIYAQYPEAEIEEAEDYTRDVPSNLPNSEWDLWGADFELTKDNAYPIKMYTSFQEEVTKGMIEPIGTLADLVTGLPSGVQAWLQFLILPLKDSEWQPHIKKVVSKLTYREEKKEEFFVVRFFQEAVEIIASALKYIFNPVEEVKEEKKDDQPLLWRLTPMEKEVMEAVEQSFNRKAFKTKLRFVLVGPRETFSEDDRKGIIGFIEQFNSPNFNTFKTNNDTKTYANYFFVDMRKRWTKKKIFLRYITRDNDGPNVILNSAELATMYHMPEMSAMSPAISRIEAKKGGPPINLPVE